MPGTQIGEFPGIASGRRKKMIPRSIPNPLDKATIVSILPLEVIEVKPTIFPGKFTIPAGIPESPSTLVVGPSSWFKEMPNDEPTLELPNSAVVVAHSIIRDWAIGLPECDMDANMPGLFFVEGNVSILEIKNKYKIKLADVEAKQKNWFHRLVLQADSLWARGNGNPLVIWDLMRMAAKMLNMNDKPWLSNYRIIEQVRCFGCGNLRDPGYPICAHCGVIDKEHPLAGGLTFAPRG